MSVIMVVASKSKPWLVLYSDPSRSMDEQCRQQIKLLCCQNNHIFARTSLQSVA